MTLKQQAFTSKQRYERITLKGSVPFSTNNGGPNTSTVTIPHGLGYAPFVRLFFALEGFSGYFQSYNSYVLNIGHWLIDTLEVDTTNITIKFLYDDTGIHTGTVYYRVYAEPQS